MGTYNLSIADECFYNNGKVILQSFNNLESGIRSAFNQQVIIQDVIRRHKGKPAFTGIKADDLNKVLRNCLALITGIKGETHVKNGVFFPVSKEGFDFTIYDDQYNFSRLYNYYVGYKGILNGDKRIIEDLSKKERGSLTKPAWRKQIMSISQQLGGLNIDYEVDKTMLTVAGEFQFGNWALAYRDIVRLLNANADPGIDFYIYITATGNLQNKLSANTVNFKQINDIFKQNSELIQIPTWIIGLDV